MKIKQGAWYKQRNGLIIGPLVRLDDLLYQFWCPNAGYKVFGADGIVSLSKWITSDNDLVEEVPADKYQKIYDQVAAEFSWFVASIVCGMLHIHLSKEIQEYHLEKTGSFANELELEFEKTFYSVRLEWPDAYKDALSCWKVIYDWDVKQSLDGLGGCKAHTFKELIKENLLTKVER